MKSLKEQRTIRRDTKFLWLLDQEHAINAIRLSSLDLRQ